jgi:hypothetical protein
MKSPWTRTTFRAPDPLAARTTSGINAVAAPAATTLANSRRLIMTMHPEKG